MNQNQLEYLTFQIFGLLLLFLYLVVKHNKLIFLSTKSLSLKFNRTERARKDSCFDINEIIYKTYEPKFLVWLISTLLILIFCPSFWILRHLIGLGADVKNNPDLVKELIENKKILRRFYKKQTGKFIIREQEYEVRRNWYVSESTDD